MTAPQDAPERAVLGEAERAALHGILAELTTLNHLLAQLVLVQQMPWWRKWWRR